jgi:hypothetical protein
MNKWFRLSIISLIFGLFGWVIYTPVLILQVTRKINLPLDFLTILAILSFLLWGLAILIGIRILKHIKLNPSQKGKGLARLAIILGVTPISISLISGILMLLFYIFHIGVFGGPHN